MSRLRSIVLGVLLGILGHAGITDGQVLTGNLAGTAKDESGGVLPGALVTLVSPALIGGPATVTSNHQGQFRFPSLAPGQYTLQVQLASFAVSSTCVDSAMVVATFFTAAVKARSVGASYAGFPPRMTSVATLPAFIAETSSPSDAREGSVASTDS